MIYLLFTVCLFTFAFVVEVGASIIGRKYKGWVTVNTCLSFWGWVHHTWNYIGGVPIMRHVGIRWFGFEWENTYEIPYGELRF